MSIILCAIGVINSCVFVSKCDIYSLSDIVQ